VEHSRAVVAVRHKELLLLLLLLLLLHAWSGDQRPVSSRHKLRSRATATAATPAQEKGAAHASHSLVVFVFTRAHAARQRQLSWGLGQQ
jgi:hypothetical protein